MKGKTTNEIKTPYMKKETPEYEKLWDELATDLVNRNEIRSALSYMRGIREFKASLREEIEKRKIKCKDRNFITMGTAEYYRNNAQYNEIEEILQLLDTVKPSTSQPEGNTVNMK